MGNHEIPRASEVIADLSALADDGRIGHLKVYKHTRAGHTTPHYYALWYAELANGRMDRATRVTRQYSGRSGKARLDAELAASRAEFDAARARNGAPSTT